MITLTHCSTGEHKAFNNDFLPRLCLLIAGGGYTVQQTTKAMEYQQIVNDKKYLKVKANNQQKAFVVIEKTED